MSQSEYSKCPMVSLYFEDNMVKLIKLGKHEIASAFDWSYKCESKPVIPRSCSWESKIFQSW